jgi:hypothetical protein
MNQIPLQATANQTLSVQLDGARYSLTFKEAGGVMVADVTRDDVVVLYGARVVSGSPIIPYAYLEAGNFVLLTEDDDLPYYTEFETTQSLVYVTADELADLRGA